MKKLLFLVTFLSVILGYGQIQTFEFSALGGAEASATSNFNDPNLGVSTITRGAGLTASANGGRFNATNWALTSIANAVTGDDYMEFTISPNSGYQFNVNSIVVNWQRSGTGNTGISLRSSVDGYASDLGGEQAIVDNTNVQVITFTFSQANSAANVTYRIYGWGEALGGSGGPEGTGNDIIVNGSVTLVGGGDTPEINIKGNNVSIVDGATPATLANHTLFGTVATNTPVVRTFTIENTGSADLVLTSPYVQLTLGSLEFTIAQPALTTIPVGGSTTFSVTFDSAAAGTFDDSIEVLSDDADEANYSFDISATAEAPTPEINIRGNSTNIVDGATTPLLTDHTSFGTLATGNTLTRTYTIQNLGTGDLTLTAPYVQLGTASTQYTITQPALTNIPVGGSTTFSVAFSSATAGTFDNTIEVLSDDADEATYSFAITADAVVLNFQPGDISFVGVTTDSDVFSFVNWIEIPVNAQLSFTDNAYEAGALKTNENTLVWRNNTGSAIQPGTVITVTCPGAGAATTDLGTVVSGSLNGLSAANENLFIYEGLSSTPNFIYGFSNIAWISTGTVTTNNSYLPAALNVTNGNIVVGTLDNYEYTGLRSGQIAIVLYKNSVNNTANWTGNDAVFALSSTDFTYVPVVTQLNPAACGVTLPFIYTSIASTILPAATGYRFEVTNLTTPADPVQVITKSVHWLRLTELAKYDYATSYSVKVMMQVGGVWLGYYGDACIVNSPSPAISNPTCGGKLTKIYDNINSLPLTGATGYRFRVTRDAEVQVLDKTVHWFKLTELPNYVYGASYTIEVAVKTSGTYSAYGSTCSLSSPAAPVIAECGQTVGASYMIHTTALSSVTLYSFEVTNLTTNDVQVIDRTVQYSPASLITGYSTATQYSIRVAVTSSGIQSEYGTPCVINTPAPSRIAKGNVDAEFKAVGYPNPFAANFTLNVTTTNDQNVKVQVYDMIGKQLENLEVNANESSDLQLGTNYPTGVYNVIVSQGDSVKSVRMIKR